MLIFNYFLVFKVFFSPGVTKQIYSKEKNDSKGAIQLEFTKTNPDSSKNNEFDNNKIDDASTEKKSIIYDFVLVIYLD